MEFLQAALFLPLRSQGNCTASAERHNKPARSHQSSCFLRRQWALNESQHLRSLSSLRAETLGRHRGRELVSPVCYKPTNERSDPGRGRATRTMPAPDVRRRLLTPAPNCGPPGNCRCSVARAGSHCRACTLTYRGGSHSTWKQSPLRTTEAVS